MTHIKLTFALLLAFQSFSTAEDAWPRFRGPDANGHAASDSKPPVKWSPKENITWRTETPGEGWSSPVIVNDRVYLTAAVSKADSVSKEKSAGFDLCLLIYDAKSGKKIKEVALLEQRADKTPKIHSKNTHASPTAIIQGDRVYAHFGYQGTVCTDLEGNKIWENRELFFRPTHGNGGSPVLVEGNIVFTCDGDKEPKIVALDADTGKVAWKTLRPLKAKKTFSFCTPAVIDVAGKKQIVAPGSDCVLALNPADGEVIWDVRYTGYSVVPKPIFESGRVYVSTSFDKAKLLAIRPDGAGVVTDSHVDWIVDRNISKTPSMIGYQGLIYSVSDNGVAQCTDADSGDVIYKKRLGGNFSASPFIAAGLIYFTDEAGVTTVVKAGEEFEVIAKNDLEERTLASAAVVNDAIFMRTADALYRIEK